MAEKSINKRSMKSFVLVTKVLPVLLAICHLINTVASYFYLELTVLNYIAGISILTIAYLYFVSYVIKLCEYYRMCLHYCVIIDVLNIYDYYCSIPVDNRSMFCIYVSITIITMFIILYLKFFK